MNNKGLNNDALVLDLDENSLQGLQDWIFKETIKKTAVTQKKRKKNDTAVIPQISPSLSRIGHVISSPVKKKKKNSTRGVDAFISKTVVDSQDPSPAILPRIKPMSSYCKKRKISSSKAANRLNNLMENVSKKKRPITAPIQTISEEFQSHRSIGYQDTINEENQASAITIVQLPMELFYEDFSWIPRKVIDLQDWAVFLNDQNISTLSKNLSADCKILNLSGLSYSPSSEVINQCFSKCPFLHSLCLSGFMGIKKLIIKVIAKCCPNLMLLDISNSVDVTDAFLQIIVTHFLNLHTINLANCTSITDAGICLITEKVVSLKSIDISGCIHLSDGAVQKIGKAFSSTLTFVNVAGCNQITDASVQSLMSSSIRRYEGLNLSFCNLITDYGIESFLNLPEKFGKSQSTLRKLKKLNLEECCRLSGVSLSWLSASSPFLESLILKNCFRIDNVGIKSLNSLVYLKELDISGCSLINDKGMNDFLKKSSNSKTPSVSLTSLNISGCNIGEETVLNLSNHCRSFEALDISSIRSVSSESLVRLVKKCHEIKSLSVGNQDGVSLSFIHALARRTRRLKQLDISSCKNVDSTALFPLRALTSLQECDISYCYQVTAKGFSHLPSSLNSLRCDGLSSIDDKCCEAISQATWKLTELSMSHCENVSKSGIIRLLNKCEELHSVNVFNCPNLTFADIKYISEDCSFKSNRELYFQECTPLDISGIYPAPKSLKKKICLRILKEFEIKTKAASLIQQRYRTGTEGHYRKLTDAKKYKKQFVCILRIQCLYRGYMARQQVSHLRRVLSTSAIYLQYRWRKFQTLRKRTRAALHWKNHSISCCFRIWKKFCKDEKSEREMKFLEGKSAKALHFWGNRTTSSIFAAWKAHINDKTWKRKRAIRQWIYRIIPRVFNKWKDFTYNAFFLKKQLISIFLNGIPIESHNSLDQKRKLKVANKFRRKVIFQLWLAFAKEQKRFVLQAMASILSNKAECWVFRNWKLNIEEKKLHREKCNKLLRKLFFNKKNKVWLAWTEFVDKCKQRKRAIAFFNSSSSVKCFFAWKKFVDEVKGNKIKTKVFLNRLLNKGLMKSVHTWREFSVESKQKKMITGKALAYFRGASVLRTFLAWKNDVQRTKYLAEKMKMRLQGDTLESIFRLWKFFVQARQLERYCATRIQSFWRGQLSRAETENYYYLKIFSTVMLQKAWRGRAGRALFWRAQRKKRLFEYTRAEKESAKMALEDEASTEYETQIKLITKIQRMWRGNAARDLFHEMKKSRYLHRKKVLQEQQEAVRIEAEKRKADRIRFENVKRLAATEIQRIARGYIGRVWYAGKQEFLRLQRNAVRLQSIQRGRIARRLSNAKRRTMLVRLELISRRKAEAKLLRGMNAKTRETQFLLRKFLRSLGLDPSSFLLSLNALKNELESDLSNVLVFVKNFLQATSQNDNSNKKSFFKIPFAKLNTTKIETHLSPTPENSTSSSSFVKKGVSRLGTVLSWGDAVRIILRGHDRCGETGLVLATHNEGTEGMAEVKMDSDGLVEFLPMATLPTEIEDMKQVIHLIPNFEFREVRKCQYIIDENGNEKRVSISPIWRHQLEVYANSMRDENVEYHAARMIQCCIRMFLARTKVQRIMSLAGIKNARQQDIWKKILAAFGSANGRTIKLLARFGIMQDAVGAGVPLEEFPEKPQRSMRMMDKFFRKSIKAKEIKLAFNTILCKNPSIYPDTGEEMPFRLNDVVERFWNRPIRALKCATNVKVANFFKKKGFADLAWFVGGSEFIRSFENRHTRVQVFTFEQLRSSSYTDSDGTAVVHGTYHPKKRKIPHGWGIAYFLRGKIDIEIEDSNLQAESVWAERGSIESQYKSLNMMKEIMWKEREERISCQILARQAKLNALRSKEGPRRYADRHHNLSESEIKLMIAYKTEVKNRKIENSNFERILNEETYSIDKIEHEKDKLYYYSNLVNQLLAAVPNVATGLTAMPCMINPVQILKTGEKIEVWDEVEWRQSTVLNLKLGSKVMIQENGTEEKKNEDIETEKSLIRNIEMKEDPEITPEAEHSELVDVENYPEAIVDNADKKTVIVEDFEDDHSEDEGTKPEAVTYSTFESHLVDLGCFAEVLYSDNHEKETFFLIDPTFSFEIANPEITSLEIHCILNSMICSVELLNTDAQEESAIGIDLYEVYLADSAKAIKNRLVENEESYEDLPEQKLDNICKEDVEIENQNPHRDTVQNPAHNVDTCLKDENVLDISSQADNINSIQEHQKAIEDVKKKLNYKQWNAQGAINVEWEVPDCNGAEITGYVVEWENTVDETSGKRLVRGNPPPSNTTLWPLDVNGEFLVRVTAENRVGLGIPSTFSKVSFKPTPMTYLTSSLLSVPVIDTTKAEGIECKNMEIEDRFTEALRNETKCALCVKHFRTKKKLVDHIANCHNIPLICPFKSCQQPCATQQTLRYHIWNSTNSTLTADEENVQYLVEIHNISSNYCLRKKRRHFLPKESHLSDEGEEYYLECKFQDAINDWLERSKKAHENAQLRSIKSEKHSLLKSNALLYPPKIHKIEYANTELVRMQIEEAITKRLDLRECKDEYVEVTTESLTKLEEEREEMMDYIEMKTTRLKTADKKWLRQSLKRDRKKAMKKLKELDDTSEDLEIEFSATTKRYENQLDHLEELKIQLQFLLERMDRVSKLNSLLKDSFFHNTERMSIDVSVVNKCHKNVAYWMNKNIVSVKLLQEWEDEMNARKRDLKKLEGKLREMQLQNWADIQTQNCDRDKSKESMALNKLRQDQRKLEDRRRQIRDSGNDDQLYTSVTTSDQRLAISNIDPVMHERFRAGMNKDSVLDKVNSADQEGDISATKQTKKKFIHKNAEVDVKSKTLVSTVSGEIQQSNDPTKFIRLECKFDEGNISGHVKIEYNDGSTYEGPWVEDVTYIKTITEKSRKIQYKKNHWGKFFNSDGSIWEGEDCNNQFTKRSATGKFVVHFPNNDIYDGEVLNGKWHGYGTLSTFSVLTAGKYIGEWKNGMRFGHGIEIFDDGEHYDGDWLNDLYHGYGRVIYEDKSEYTGFFKEGLYHGRGTFINAFGDQIVGIFEFGCLNGEGTCQYMDNRYYSGLFENTQPHGKGVLTYPNADRLEGTFFNGKPHGECVLHAHAKAEDGGEFFIRVGKWEHGVRKLWLSTMVTKVATNTFVEYFAEISQGRQGVKEIYLLKEKFKTPYAVMVASMLPNLPPGVDPDDIFVKSIVQLLAKVQNVVIGSEIIDTTAELLEKCMIKVQQLTTKKHVLRNDVDKLQMDVRDQIKQVREVNIDLELMLEKEAELQNKIEAFWKNDSRCCEKMYKKAVLALNKVELMEWYKLRKFKPDKMILSLMEAFCILLNFTSNVVLNNVPFKPEKMDIMKLLGNNEENVHLGDKEGLIHKYNVKALYLLPLFDVYSFATGARRQMLQSIAYVIHNPRLRPNNFRLSQISEAIPAVCSFVRAAFFYSQTACDIFPVYERLLHHLKEVESEKVIVERENDALINVKLELQKLEKELNDVEIELNDEIKEEKRLSTVICNIKDLDAMEDLPTVKEATKREIETEVEELSTQEIEFMDDDELQLKIENEIVAEKKLATRKRFEEDEDVREAYDLLKKEIKKVLKECEGSLPVKNLLVKYDSIMHKPLDLTIFGIKKIRQLIEWMPDVCELVPAPTSADVDLLVLVQSAEEIKSQLYLPKKKYSCEVCIGLSYDTQSELESHYYTRWHIMNTNRLNEGEFALEYTKVSMQWVEAYDETGGLIFENQVTKEVVSERPLEMDANDVSMHSLSNSFKDENLVDKAESFNNIEGIKKTDEETIENLDPKQAEKIDDWEVIKDEDGNIYYFNPTTQESTWEKPTEDNQESLNNENGRVQNAGNNPWVEYFDEESRHVYYYNSETGETTWDTPH